MGNITNINNNTNIISQANNKLGATTGLIRGINNLEQAIKSKGGTITKANRFPSLSELKLGVETIPQQGTGGSNEPDWRFLAEDMEENYLSIPEDGMYMKQSYKLLDELLPLDLFNDNNLYIKTSFPDSQTYILDTRGSEDTTINYLYPSSDQQFVLSDDGNWAAMVAITIAGNCSSYLYKNDSGGLAPEFISEEGKTVISFASALIRISEGADIPETEEGIRDLPFIQISELLTGTMTPSEIRETIYYSDNPLDIVIPSNRSTVLRYAFAGKTIRTLTSQDREEDLTLEENAFLNASIDINQPDPLVIKRLARMGNNSISFTGASWSRTSQVYSREIQLPDFNMDRIPSGAFSGNHMLRMTIPSTVRTIESGAFDGFGGEAHPQFTYGTTTDACSQLTTKIISEANLTVTYCDCNVFGIVQNDLGDTTNITQDTQSLIKQSTIEFFDDMASYFASFIAEQQLSGSLTQLDYSIVPKQYEKFMDLVSLIAQEDTRWPTQVSDQPERTIVVGINKPFTITFGDPWNWSEAETIQYTSLQTAISRIFGYSDWDTFAQYAQNIVVAYIQNSAGASTDSIQNRLKYKGTIYTKNNSFILPFSMRGSNSENYLDPMFILDPEGTLSLWMPDISSLFRTANMQVTPYNDEISYDGKEITILGRCILFDTTNDILADQLPHLSMAEGTEITRIDHAAFRGSGLDNSSYGKFSLSELGGIPENSFSGCRQLTRFRIDPQSEFFIGAGAFQESAIEEFNFGGSSRLASIGSSAFYRSRLRRFKMERLERLDEEVIEVSNIEYNAFADCRRFPKNDLGEVLPLKLVGIQYIGTSSLLNTAFTKLILSNPDHPDIVPSLGEIDEAIQDKDRLKTMDIEIPYLNNGSYISNWVYNGTRINTLKACFTENTFDPIQIMNFGAQILDIDLTAVQSPILQFLDSVQLNEEDGKSINIGKLILRSSTMVNLEDMHISVTKTVTIIEVPAELLSEYESQYQSVNFQAIQ